MDRIYLLVELECSKPDPDLPAKVAGRAHTMDAVEKADAIVIDSRLACELARAQMEKAE